MGSNGTVDRRRLLKQAAVIGAAAWTAPLIMSEAASADAAGTPKCQSAGTLTGTIGAIGCNNLCGFSLTFGPAVCPCGGTAASTKIICTSATTTSGQTMRFFNGGCSGGGTSPLTVDGNGGSTTVYALAVSGGSATSLTSGDVTVTMCLYRRCPPRRAGFQATWRCTKLVWTATVSNSCQNVNIGTPSGDASAGNGCGCNSATF